MKKPIPLAINKRSWSVAIAAVKGGSAVEVSNLDELLDLNRSIRPEVLVDMDGKLRAVLVVRGSILVSKPVDVVDVVVQARKFHGETFTDSVLNCIEKLNDPPTV